MLPNKDGDRMEKREGEIEREDRARMSDSDKSWIKD